MEGNPGWVVPKARERGMLVTGCVGNTKNAIRLMESGVDFVIAQGYEGGGHTGRIGTMSLIPQVNDAVSPLPVVAAGGIVDGRGLAAALTLGAEGVWLGTAWPHQRPMPTLLKKKRVTTPHSGTRPGKSF